jgi:hypothetical protein
VRGHPARARLVEGHTTRFGFSVWYSYTRYELIIKKHDGGRGCRGGLRCGTGLETGLGHGLGTCRRGGYHWVRGTRVTVTATKRVSVCSVNEYTCYYFYRTRGSGHCPGSVRSDRRWFLVTNILNDNLQFWSYRITYRISTIVPTVSVGLTTSAREHQTNKYKTLGSPPRRSRAQVLFQRRA